jgi:5-methylcytosine-specific restriction endonuclease McrA
LTLKDIDNLALRTIKTPKLLIRVIKCLTPKCPTEIHISDSNRTGYCVRCTPVYGKKQPFESLYNKMCSDAMRNNVQCELTYQQFRDICEAEKECAYCGKEVNRARYGRYKTALGGVKYAAKFLDRKNPSGPYSIANVVTCCKECNLIKHATLSYDEMLLLMRLRKIRGELCLSH